MFELEQRREKVDAALHGVLEDREADAASIGLDAAMRRIGEPGKEGRVAARAPTRS